MPESPRLVDLVQSRLDGFLGERGAELRGISPDLDVVDECARRLLAGGKRFRALFCYWGWRAVSAHTEGFDPLDDTSDPDLEAIVSIAAGLEVFHASALVHDDIMDNSDLRRGQPSVHRAFAILHRERGWDGSPDAYGLSSALLLGDLLLGWSDQLVDAGVALADNVAAGRAARAEFAQMRTEVTAGQYLDIFEEMAWRALPEDEHLSRAQRVIVYKSAKYSVEAPLAIGGSLADGSLAQIAALREFGLPLGIAFQLRDDLLGVFGDPAVTGKPAGDDLREGKRTVLITLVRQKLPASAAHVFDELLGDRTLDADQIAMLQTAVRDSGAVDHVERVIAHHLDQARAALADAPLARSARDELTALADAVTRRTS
ncbi:MAG TPA: polyprenyl synthetase family protein [Pseudolysinimonas sp.]|nr:polyprenyl synthetase family protein [Pseudolysinimonas sp.]